MKELEELKTKFSNNTEALDKIKELELLLKSDVDIQQEMLLLRLKDNLSKGIINESVIEDLKSINNYDNIREVLNLIWILLHRVEDTELNNVLYLFKFLIRESK
jgi:hypothetical protein